MRYVILQNSITNGYCYTGWGCTVHCLSVCDMDCKNVCIVNGK